MQRILYLLPDLEYGGANSQLSLLAAGLPRDRFLFRVGVLGRTGPARFKLKRAGVEPEVLDWHRLVDIRPAVALHRLLREFQPHLIHAWGLCSAWSVALATWRRGVSLIVSDPFGVPGRSSWLRHRLDCSVLRRADRIVVHGEAEAERLKRQRLPARQVAIIPPGVQLGAAATSSCLPNGWDVPDHAAVILGIGPFLPHKDHRDAVWAFDILRYLYNNLYLVLVGTGPHQARLVEFARAVRTEDRLRLLGAQAEVAPFLERAAVVWLTGRAGSGVNAALEAMAASRPVVGYRLPPLAEVVIEGETGFLVKLGDKAALARQTRRLLDDPALRRRFGAAGRQRAETSFSPAALVRQHMELYAALG